MPAKATVFDKKCNPLLELGTGPYNTIRWNPKGKCILQWKEGSHILQNIKFIHFLQVSESPFFLWLYVFVKKWKILFTFVALILWFSVLCLAGFGNLPGDMVCYFRCFCFIFLPFFFVCEVVWFGPFHDLFHFFFQNTRMFQEILPSFYFFIIFHNIFPALEKF